jgi:hypothetical protein
VKFYFVYKTLAHPELAGDYVQPFTTEERLAHARQAVKQLGATIPWLVDPIDNRLKHALGERPNSEFVIDPKGKIVRKRAWSHPPLLRKDLEELVGKAPTFTREEDLKLTFVPPPKAPAARGVVPRVPRSKMQAIEMVPQIEKDGLPFFAKLRAEADADLLKEGTGKLYLGFHLDPFHEAHWNNLTKPLRYTLDLPEGMKVDKPDGEGVKAKAADADPREFILDVEDWPEDKPVTLTVIYAACVGEKTCHEVKQSYVLRRKRDKDGGGARGAGAGYWTAEDLLRMGAAKETKGAGNLTKETVIGLLAPHFDEFDVNKDGELDLEELKAVAEWLNHHLGPGRPVISSKKK